MSKFTLTPPPLLSGDLTLYIKQLYNYIRYALTSIDSDNMTAQYNADNEKRISNDEKAISNNSAEINALAQTVKQNADDTKASISTLLNYIIVDELPSSGVIPTNTIYMVLKPSAERTETSKYNHYLRVNGHWEMI